MIISTLRTLFAHLITPFLWVLFWDTNDHFISKEGWEVLDDPIKREKLNNYIENWKQTGVWDPEILN